jgi:hypothetical protein
MSSTITNPGNIAKSVYEPSIEAIKVTVVGSGSPTVPNIVRLTDGTDYLTSTTIGADTGLDVNILNTMEIAISHIDDSIRLGDGSSLVSTTTVGPKVGLDVNVAAGDLNAKPVGLTVSGSFVELTIDSTTWTLVTVTNVLRNHIWLQNQSAVDIKINPDNTTVGYKGIIIEPGQSVNIDIQDDIPMYLKAASGTGNIVGRMELA